MTMMNLIECDAECMHQKEGYCCLEHTSKVTNSEGGCAYYEKKPNYRTLSNAAPASTLQGNEQHRLDQGPTMP